MSKPAAVSKTQPRKQKNVPAAPREPNLEWVKNVDWTWSIITYLTNHPMFHIKLYLDSTADASKNGQPHVIAKDGKQQQYAVLAKHIFCGDAEHKKAYAVKPSRFVKSVETRLRQ